MEVGALMEMYASPYSSVFPDEEGLDQVDGTEQAMLDPQGPQASGGVRYDWPKSCMALHPGN